MVSLRIDERTAEQLQSLAADRGMTIEGFLQALAAQRQVPQAAMSDEEIEVELKPLLFKAPALPADFSREDVYADHD